jgi:hypothetical protein
LGRGKIYPTLDDKVEAVENYLNALSVDPERVKQLAGWEWISASLDKIKKRPDQG